MLCYVRWRPPITICYLLFDHLKLSEAHLIYKVIAGSHAYGMATPESDVDVRGVCIPPKKYLLGLSRFEQLESKQEDSVIYGLSKFVSLALGCNPNIIELLHVDPQHILHMDPLGERLREARGLFLSRRAARTFGGYALSQLKRIEGHYRWLKNPPDHQPSQDEFGGVWDGSTYQFPNRHLEQNYRAALKQWNDYQRWRENRNPQRAALEEKYGYDTKHAAHLLRLYRMGIEVVRDGVVQVLRPDGDWLLQIRNGLLTYEELMSLVGEYDQALKEAESISPLPRKPDFDAAARLVIEMHEESLRIGV